MGGISIYKSCKVRWLWKQQTLLGARVETHDLLGPHVGGEDGALRRDPRAPAASGRPPRGLRFEPEGPAAEPRRRRQYGSSRGRPGRGGGASGERD